ncbi:Carbonic anhydrase [Syntrophomonas zehnderi OL-4]|uniref:carbonic anhydrase n=1 Tax=Syntrophomonas zehnderi OL-4 TaxID=690567 RepID=A0A0E3W3H6_9FIRM|nr:carbonic anhydrase [Syntrophomonas zehnderi]CFX83647.1 Carbonic anhydrase [Syntrophomonas zehnderi OL-4]
MAAETVYQRPEVVTAPQALQLLAEGNQRYVEGMLFSKNLDGSRRKELFNQGQKPFAVVLTCSDSRVPPELIFDQALGDLFVIRVAGNVVSKVEMGSIEYGVEHLNTPLLVIMGHENCGAVKATVDGGEVPGSIDSIIEIIKPSVENARVAGFSGADLYEAATDENTKAMVAEVMKSPVVKHLVDDGRLVVLGAKYHLDSGRVVFDQTR